MGRVTTALRRAVTWIGRATGLVPAQRFAGATHPLLQAWAAGTVMPNDLLRMGLADLRARSRDFCRNNGEAAGFLRDLESDVVGHEGVILQTRLRFSASGTVRDSVNDRIEGAYRAWSAFGEPTTDGRHSRASLARLMMRTVAQDGEFFALKVLDGPYGYRLEPFDAALVDETKTQAAAPGRNAIDMGVEVDARGRAVAYHIRRPAAGQRDGVTAATVTERVDAEFVLHVFLPLWPNQHRGVPWLAPVLLAAKIESDYTEAELMQARLSATNGAFFEAEDGAIWPGPTNDRNEPQAMAWDATPGFGQYLPPGWKAKPWTPTHPSANYVGFIGAIKKGIARGSGRSYASWTGDLSQVNYSSIRVDRLRELDFNRLMQHAVLLDQFERVVFREWLVAARRIGALPIAPAIDTQRILESARYQTRGWAYTDPVKDAQAAAMLLALGLTNRSREAAKLGLDFYDLIEERVEEEAWARDRGITLSQGPSTLIAGPDAAPAAPEDDPTDEDMDDDEEAQARGLRVA